MSGLFARIEDLDPKSPRRLINVIAGSGDLRPRRGLGELYVAAFAILVRPHSIQPQEGRVLSATAQGLELFLPCEHAAVGRAALEVVLGVARGDPALDALSAAFEEVCALEALAHPAMTLARAAAARGIPVARALARTQIIRLGQGVHGRRFADGVDDSEGHIARALTQDRLVLLRLLNAQEVVVVKAQPATTPDQALISAAALGFPLRVTPRMADAPFEPRDVADEAALLAALTEAEAPALLAKAMAGEDHELSVGNGAVTGPSEMHEDNRRLAARAARIAGLPRARVVLRSEDLAVSWRRGLTAVRDVQPLDPPPGPPSVRAPEAILGEFFPGGADGRIPIAGVTGSMGKSTTCHMLSAILAEAGHTVGRTATQGAWVGEDRIGWGDAAGGGMARVLLADPAIDAAVFELARGGLARNGLGLDGVDVGVVLNVRDHHLGFDSIETREDMARIKGIVARSARRLAVLNADDPLCLAMAAGLPCEKIGLVTENFENAAWREHRAAGGLAACIAEDGGDDAQTRISLYLGDWTIASITAAELPSSLGGRYRPPMIAAMNAMAAAHGLGIDPAVSVRALGRFVSDTLNNPGRMNRVDGLPFELILTWADGADAYAALVALARKTPARRRILMFNMMGNRADAFIDEGAASVAGAFDHYICCDWLNLRDRAAGEVPERLAAGLRRAGVDGDAISVILDHDAAAEAALAMAGAGDLVIMVTPRTGSERILRSLGRWDEPVAM